MLSCRVCFTLRICHLNIRPLCRRLPGPSRAPAAGGGSSRSPGSSNLNRRSQSFNSIDKSKPLQYASGNDRGESAAWLMALESSCLAGAEGSAERPRPHSPSPPLGGTAGSGRRGPHFTSPHPSAESSTALCTTKWRSSHHRKSHFRDDRKGQMQAAALPSAAKLIRVIMFSRERSHSGVCSSLFHTKVNISFTDLVCK